MVKFFLFCLFLCVQTFGANCGSFVESFSERVKVDFDGRVSAKVLRTEFTTRKTNDPVEQVDQILRGLFAYYFHPHFMITNDFGWMSYDIVAMQAPSFHGRGVGDHINFDSGSYRLNPAGYNIEISHDLNQFRGRILRPESKEVVFSSVYSNMHPLEVKFRHSYSPRGTNEFGEGAIHIGGRVILERYVVATPEARNVILVRHEIPTSTGVATPLGSNFDVKGKAYLDIYYTLDRPLERPSFLDQFTPEALGFLAAGAKDFFEANSGGVKIVDHRVRWLFEGGEFPTAANYSSQFQRLVGGAVVSSGPDYFSGN